MPDSDIVISAEGLSKAYRLGIGQEVQGAEGRNPLSRLVQPIRKFLHLWRLDTARAAENRDDPNLLWALDDVNFQVRRGEVLGIIGEVAGRLEATLRESGVEGDAVRGQLEDLIALCERARAS